MLIDIQLLLAGKEFKGSKLMSLDPCIENNLLRVDGRVQASLLDPDEKHALILPFNCKFSKLIIGYCHEKKLHNGIRLTHSSVRREFWIIKSRNMIRSYIHKRNTCIRYKANRLNQKM